MTNLISRTGRVQNWIDDPDSRLPVSCTVFVVEDSMEGPNGIEASWRFTSTALRYGAGVAIHLSKLRPKGSENGKGLNASGPVSFGKIYSTLNDILRRGGQRFKKGACVLHLDLDHHDIIAFIKTPRSELPWVKRCVNINEVKWETASQDVKDALIYGIRSGDIWLNKTKYDKNGKRIRGNVCLEVYLPSRGTCLLQHVNLGACTISDVSKGFVEGIRSLCDLHSKTGVASSGEYLPSTTDRQVGLGVLGLANLLRQNNITYEQFGDALQAVNDGIPGLGTAGLLAAEFYKGIQSAADVAREYNMESAFAIAPTACCSYRS